jgi:hypothetical protein
LVEECQSQGEFQVQYLLELPEQLAAEYPYSLVE